MIACDGASFEIFTKGTVSHRNSFGDQFYERLLLIFLPGLELF